MVERMKGVFRFIREFDLEAFVWIAGLLYLALINPYSTNHFGFCLFKLLGFEHCPGCGLGLSISYLFHGDIAHSFQAHPLGGAAIIVLTYRIFSLLRKTWSQAIVSIKAANQKEKKHGECYTDYA